MFPHSRASRAVETKFRPQTPSQPSPLARTGTEAGGQALDRHMQARMAAKFGHDFSQVRIHTDARAGDAAAALGANAYAHGSDIVFGAGQWTPGSPQTERLLAHELTHVVQQSQAGTGDASRASRREDASEREADTLAGDVTAGRSVDVQARPGAAVARDAGPDPFMAPYEMAMARMGMSIKPKQPEESWTENPLWKYGTNDALSGAVGLEQTHLGNLHEDAANKSIAAANKMDSDFRLGDFQENHGLPPSSGGTAEELAAQKNLWRAGSDLEGAENAGRGASTAMQAERTVANTASEFSGPLKAAGAVGKFLSPFGLVSDSMSLVDDWKQGNHVDAAVDAMGITSSAIGTADLAGAGLSMFGATAGAGGALSSFAAAANPVGAVAGSAAGGYAAGKLALKGANAYAKDQDIFGEGRDTTEAAGDAGMWVQNHVSGTKGKILGGIAAVGSSWGTAAYSGIHAVGHGVSEDAHWLWNHTLGDSGPSDEEIAAGTKTVEAGLEETDDALIRADEERELYGN
jgi:hypothetical protein